MPVFDVYSMGSTITTINWEGTSAPPTVTVTVGNSGSQGSGKTSSGKSGSLSSGVVAAIAVVSVLVVICVVTAARLHMWWCMNLRCRLCFFMRCGRRKTKTRRGRTPHKRSSTAPSFGTKSYERSPVTPEKSLGSIQERSPLDRYFPPDSAGASTLVASPRLQEVGGNKPRYLHAHSIISNIAQITTPPTDSSPPLPTLPSATPTPPPQEPVQEPDSEPEEQTEQTEQHTAEELHPPSAFSTFFGAARSRASHVSGVLSIITLPSFITNDRPRPYSSSAALQMESPVQPQSHYRKRSSVFSHRFSATDSGTPNTPGTPRTPGTPISPGSDSTGKRSRPTSSALQLITSVLKRSGSNSSLRSSSPSSRRSSRRSLGRRNLSGGVEDEAAIQWKKLPPIPAVRGASPMPNRDSQRTIKELSPEPLPSYTERDPRPPFCLASQIPLPPSPSTLASTVSSLSYAPPSPQEIPPVNGFTTPYGSYPPLPPSLPSTPGKYSYPPLPPSLPPSLPSTPCSSDRFTDAYSTISTDRPTPFPLAPLRRIPSEISRPWPDFSPPSTATASIFPGYASDSFSDEGSRRSIFRRSGGSIYSQVSGYQEIVVPPRPLLNFPSSPPPPPSMSPRGPRPRPLPAPPISRSGTLHSQKSSSTVH